MVTIGIALKINIVLAMVVEVRAWVIQTPVMPKKLPARSTGKEKNLALFFSSLHWLKLITKNIAAMKASERYILIFQGSGSSKDRMIKPLELNKIAVPIIAAMAINLEENWLFLIIE